MITAQDIRERTFKKSKIGGYDMEEIDEFLEEIADDLTAAQKESAVLKSKMKVLVDKIEEYRSNEAALNQAVLSAQKLAVQIEKEARERASAIILEAEQQSNSTISAIDEKVKAENIKLDKAKEESAKFLSGIKAMYSAHLKNIATITEDEDFVKLEKTIKTDVKETAAPVKTAAAAPAKKPVVSTAVDLDATFEEIEKNVSKIEPQPTVTMDLFSDVKEFYPPVKDPDRTQPFTF